MFYLCLHCSAVTGLRITTADVMGKKWILQGWLWPSYLSLGSGTDAGPGLQCLIHGLGKVVYENSRERKLFLIRCVKLDHLATCETLDCYRNQTSKNFSQSYRVLLVVQIHGVLLCHRLFNYYLPLFWMSCHLVTSFHFCLTVNCST